MQSRGGGVAPTPHQLSAGFVFCFSIASLWYRLLSFCYVTDDMESRSQGQCSAKHDGTTRAHPDNRKMKVKNFFALCVERLFLRTSIHCLRQWLYHSKIPRAGAVMSSKMMSSGSHFKGFPLP